MSNTIIRNKRIRQSYMDRLTVEINKKNKNRVVVLDDPEKVKNEKL